MNKNITHIGDNWKNLSIHIALVQDYPNATDYLCDAASNNLLGVTDEAGLVVEHLRYDAWGVRKEPETWTTDWSAGTVTDRGYTMHEHLDEFRLINMNGRIYDPVLGRFLSPDNYIQAPDNPQSYNRYSYVLNNPLKYTDPSGYSLESFMRGILNVLTMPGRVLAGATAWINNKINGNTSEFGYFNTNYLLYGNTNLSAMQGFNLKAGVLNSIANGGPGFGGYAYNNFAQYDRLQAQSLQNQLNAFFASLQEYSITEAPVSNQEPDQSLASADDLSTFYEKMLAKEMAIAQPGMMGWIEGDIDEPDLKSIFVAKLCVVLNFCLLINNELTAVQKFKTS